MHLKRVQMHLKPVRMHLTRREEIFLLYVDGTTMWAGTFLVDESAAIATEITMQMLATPALQRKHIISDEQGVAYIIQGGHAEYDIVDGTNAQKAKEIEQDTTRGGEMATHIVDRSDGD